MNARSRKDRIESRPLERRDVSPSRSDSKHGAALSPAETERAPVEASRPVLPRLWPWLLILGGLSFWLAARGIEDVGTIPYSEFLAHLERGDVRSLLVSESTLEGVMRVAPPAQPAAAGEGEVTESAGAPELTRRFRSVRIEDPDLVARLQAAGVDYAGERASPWGGLLLTWLLPLLFLVLLLGWMFRSVGRGGAAGSSLFGFGKSQARLVPETGTGVTFEDVAGCDEAKAALSQMVDFLREPQRFTALGARIPKGVLLLGPPGTGKTLLARAVAGEAGVPFFSISGSDFVEMFVGVGAARVRDLFEQAQKSAPCIVFIDEIDAVGRQRGISMGVVNDEREQTLNQLLSELDGFEANSGVILLAATNRPDVLDRALLRPGRFDRQVLLDAPDRAGRRAILGVHAKGKPFAPDVDLDAIAATTSGMSGADLANALNEAALAAADEHSARITQRHIEEGVERVAAGPERRSRRLDAEERRRVACHEAGHALVATLCPHADPVHKVSIVPRGRAALGYTLQVPEEDQYIQTVDELHDRLTVLLGGRAAEELVAGSVSTGAEDDLRAATAVARQMVCLFGMSEMVGLPQCARPENTGFVGGHPFLQRDCSEATAREAECEVRRILDEAFARARELVTWKRARLDELIAALLERETLGRKELEQILGPEPPRAELAGVLPGHSRNGVA